MEKIIKITKGQILSAEALEELTGGTVNGDFVPELIGRPSWAPWWCRLLGWDTLVSCTARGAEYCRPEEAAGLLEEARREEVEILEVSPPELHRTSPSVTVRFTARYCSTGREVSSFSYVPIPEGDRERLLEWEEGGSMHRNPHTGEEEWHSHPIYRWRRPPTA